MKKFVTFIYALIVFLIIDYFWLTVIAYDFFQNHLGHLMRENVIMWSAFAFYVIFIFGLCIFVIFPSIESKSVKKAAILGALFGFVCYSSFDFTSYAIFKGYPLEVVFIVVLWGGLLGSLTSLIVVKTISK